MNVAFLDREMVGWVECNEPRQANTSISIIVVGLVALDPPYAVFCKRNQP
jgi:hypothetical protein